MCVCIFCTISICIISTSNELSAYIIYYYVHLSCCIYRQKYGCAFYGQTRRHASVDNLTGRYTAISLPAPTYSSPRTHTAHSVDNIIFTPAKFMFSFNKYMMRIYGYIMCPLSVYYIHFIPHI